LSHSVCRHPQPLSKQIPIPNAALAHVPTCRLRTPYMHVYTCTQAPTHPPTHHLSCTYIEQHSASLQWQCAPHLGSTHPHTHTPTYPHPYTPTSLHLHPYTYTYTETHTCNHSNTTQHYTKLHYTTLHNTTLNYTTQQNTNMRESCTQPALTSTALNSSTASSAKKHAIQDPAATVGARDNLADCEINQLGLLALLGNSHPGVRGQWAALHIQVTSSVASCQQPGQQLTFDWRC